MTVEEMVEVTAEVKDWEMACTADSVGSVDRTPAGQSLDPTEQKTKPSVNGEYMP